MTDLKYRRKKDKIRLVKAFFCLGGEKIMKTFLFDLDDTIINLNWPVFEKRYYGGLAESFCDLMPKEKVGEYIYQSYRYMVEVVDGQTNKAKFYDKMQELSGVDKAILIKREPTYYLDHYDELQPITTVNADMVAAVKTLKTKGYRLILASQPVFPSIATRKRLAWAGLNEAIFDKITTFESECASKPDLAYYRNLLTEFDLKPEDCIMVGNDRAEDMIATELGISGILITDVLFDSADTYPCIEMTAKQFREYVESL